MKNTGGPKKVNLCTTKFVDDSKTLPSTEVAMPIPLPVELAHFTQRGEAEMPTGERGAGSVRSGFASDG